MKYFVDTEFDGFGGKLLSIAVVREDGEFRSFILEANWNSLTPWVTEHVMPFFRSGKLTVEHTVTPYVAMREIVKFMATDSDPIVVADWPDDIRYFCELLIVGPGKMHGINRLKFEMVRVDAYPTTLEGAVQHNAWWDAMALREKIQNG